MLEYLRTIVEKANLTFYLNSGGPGTTLSVIMLLAGIALVGWTLYTLEREHHIFSQFTGITGPNGLKRMWMFSHKPYMSVLAVSGTLAGGFVAVCLAVILLGIAVFLLFLLIKFLLVALVWIGYAALIGGALALFGGLRGESGEAAGVGCGGVIIGGPIVLFADTLDSWGDSFAQWGHNVLDNLNFFDWLWNIVSGCWELVSVIALAPLAVFLVIALAVILADVVAMAVEWAVMRYYRVHQRCPQCGGNDYDYIVQGKTYPVALRPGVYGIFHHDFEGVKVPTMMLNGKGALARQCRHCNHRVGMTGEKQVFGTDLHTGFVGAPSTGKSWLIYGALHRLLERAGKRGRQVDITSATDIKRMHRLMESGGSFQTVASQYTRAVQVMIDRPDSRVPWHLYWWDVAGENFDRALQPTEMDFYRHVSSIVFVIDPLLVDYGAEQPSVKLAAWLKQHSHRPVTSLDDTLTHLTNILERYGRRLADIHITVVLVKADKGYIDQVTGTPYTRATGDQLRSFVVSHMRQRNLVTNLDNEFASVSFMAVSVADDTTVDDDRLINHLLALQEVEM